MKSFWLNKKNNKKLIVFFNGWGMNETPVKHLNCADYDVLVLYDYREFDFDFKNINLSNYDEKYLICWSMGVYVSNLFYDDLKSFDKKIAINGTNQIIDDEFGIPKKIYNITAKCLNEESKDKFILNMFKGGKLNPDIKIDRPLLELKDELISIQKINLVETLEFDKIIISNDDKIIPSKNQINYWETNNKNYELINSTHCPFEIYQNWNDLIC